MSVAQVLVLPGWGGSSSGHWQSLWVRDRPGFSFVRQRDWDTPDRDEWIATLDRAVAECAEPPVLVGHSLACHMVAHWSAAGGGPVRLALLVAPPDIEYSVAHGAAAVAGFGPPSSTRLGFPAVLAASRTDQWSTIEWSRRLAATWGARFVDLGESGHVNTDSGHGPWPEGEKLLAEALARQP